MIDRLDFGSPKFRREAANRIIELTGDISEGCAFYNGNATFNGLEVEELLTATWEELPKLSQPTEDASLFRIELVQNGVIPVRQEKRSEVFDNAFSKGHYGSLRIVVAADQLIARKRLRSG